MRVIVANYRYFIAGGPERYMFNFMEAAGKLGVEVIPFSIQNPQNCPTEYAPYFARPRADALMYADTKRSGICMGCCGPPCGMLTRPGGCGG